jgi:hypothetical protein
MEEVAVGEARTLEFRTKIVMRRTLPSLQQQAFACPREDKNLRLLRFVDSTGGAMIWRA